MISSEVFPFLVKLKQVTMWGQRTINHRWVIYCRSTYLQWIKSVEGVVVHKYEKKRKGIKEMSKRGGDREEHLCADDVIVPRLRLYCYSSPSPLGARRVRKRKFSSFWKGSQGGRVKSRMKKPVLTGNTGITVSLRLFPFPGDTHQIWT